MKFPAGIRAEILINAHHSRIQKLHDQYHVNFLGGFTRNYQHDISHLSTEQPRKEEIKLRIYLNRNGLYDKLPEALFHRIDHVINKRGGFGKTENEDIFDFQVKQRTNARRFFQPAENEFFKIGVKVESIITEHLLNSNKLTIDYLFGKNDNRGTQSRKHPALFLYNALFFSIRGNIGKIRMFLSAALQAEVLAFEDQAELQYANSNHDFNNTLGRMIVGDNAVCGSFFTDHSIRWVFRVKAREHLLHRLIEDPDHIQIFDFVKNSLIPAGIEGDFEIIGSEQKNLVLLSAAGNDAKQYLGYNVAI